MILNDTKECNVRIKKMQPRTNANKREQKKCGLQKLNVQSLMYMFRKLEGLKV